MKRRVRQMVLKRLWLRDSWVITFLLGFIMLNFPFVAIFNKPVQVAGIPLLYLYLQIGWIASIVVAYLFSRAQERKMDDERRS